MGKTDEAALPYADFREVIRPKRPLVDIEFVPKPYYQVYEHKIGFQANLSILDLLSIWETKLYSIYSLMIVYFCL